MYSNNSCDRKDAANIKYVCSKTYRQECVDCANYKRKAVEAGKKVSARDVHIEMLQKEVKKVESLYKNSIDEYEKLRFNHCTTIQQLTNLKAIHKKVKDDNVKLTESRDCSESQLLVLQNETEKYTNQYKTLENQYSAIATMSHVTPVSDPSCPHKDIIKEVINIESNIETQNRRVKDLMSKLLDEAQYNCKPEDVTDKKVSKTGSEGELVNIIEDLSTQIDKLNTLVATLQSENEVIKYQLTEKISNLSSCLSDLEKNHSNINGLSETIENIISEKENSNQVIETLKNAIEQNNKQIKLGEEEISGLKSKYDEIVNETEQLQREKLKLKNEVDEWMQKTAKLQEESYEKEKSWNDSKLKLLDKLKQLEQTKQSLNARIAALTNENKSNSEKITEFDRRFSESSKESEKSELLLKQQNSILVTELREVKKKLEQKAREEGSEEKINQLNAKIISLKKEVEGLTSENTEYEEENKYLCQQTEKLNFQMRDLEKQKLQADEDIDRCCKIIDDLKEECNKLDAEKKKELDQLKGELDEIRKNQELLYTKDTNEFRNQVTLLEEELNKVKSLKANAEQENDNLQAQINDLRTELYNSQKYHDESKSKIDLMGEDIKRVQFQKGEVERENENLKKQINNLQRHSIEYDKDNSDNKHKISLLEKELKKVKDMKAEVEDENKNLRNQIHNLETELTDVHRKTDNQILDLQGKCNELEKQQKEKSEQICRCSNKLQCIKNSADEQKLDNEKYLSTLENLEKQKRALEKEQIKLDNEVGQNLEEIKFLKVRIQECKETAIKNENDMKDVKSINEKLQEEIETMSIECCRDERLISHLEQCIETSNKLLEQCEAELKQMHIENEVLKKENENLKRPKHVCKAAQPQKINKQEQTDVLKQNQQVGTEGGELYHTHAQSTNTTNNFGTILEEIKTKDEDIEGLRDQLESIQRSSDIYKSEYENLKKAYTEVKESLVLRKEAYNTEKANQEKADVKIGTTIETDSKLAIEKRLREMELTMMDREIVIQNLQYRLKESSCDVCQVKEYVNKLVADNKSLKMAIDNLLNSLLDKFRNIQYNGKMEDGSSAQMLLQDILGSLINFEKHITRNTHSCSLDSCNCMSVISSQYKPDNIKSIDKVKSKISAPCKQAVRVLKTVDSISASSSEIFNVCLKCCHDVEDIKPDTGTSDCGCCCSCNHPNQSKEHDDKENTSKDASEPTLEENEALTDESYIIEPKYGE